METPEQLHSLSDILRHVLIERIHRNPSYSLRALGRDLKVSHTYLSLILNGKKSLPPRRAFQFAQALELNPALIQSLVNMTVRQDGAISKRRCSTGIKKAVLLETDRFHSISDWYHVAILELTLVKGFRSSSPWIAGKLGISVATVNEALKRLHRLGLIEKENGKWRKCQVQLAVPTYYSTSAIRQFHEQMIGKALKALSSPRKEDYEARDITGTTMPINPARLAEAKGRIKRFRKDLMRFLSEGECTELYQLNVQLFSLTRPDPSSGVGDSQ